MNQPASPPTGEPVAIAVPAEPVPQTWNVVALPNPRGGLVQLSITDVYGSHCMWLPPDQVSSLVVALEKYAAEARTGLVVPSPHPNGGT